MRMFEWTKRKSKGEIILYSLVSLLFMAVALSYLYILVWMIMSGLKTHTEIVMDPFAWPEKANWSHFVDVWKMLNVNGHGFFEMFFNSIYFSVLGAGIQQFVSMTLAYACTKYEFPGSKLIGSIILVMITLPLYGTGGAAYVLQYKLGLIDTYARIIVSASGFNTLFLYYSAFFKNISNTYMEAAKMDGANDFSTYFRIMIPQAKGMFGALFLTQWIAEWNNYENYMVYLPNIPTLPVGIYQFNTEMLYRARLDILFAACVITVIPAIILYVVFNKAITTNVSVGGIKG